MSERWAKLDELAGSADGAKFRIQPFSPDYRRTRYQTVGRNDDVSCLQRLEQPESYPASLFDSLVFRNAGDNGICPHLVTAAYGCIETVIPFNGERSDKGGIRNRL